MSAPTLHSTLVAWWGAKSLRRLAALSPDASWRARAGGIYDDATASLVLTLASIPGDETALEEALVAAWREAASKEPGALDRHACGVIARSAVEVRKIITERLAGVTAIATQAPRGDA